MRPIVTDLNREAQGLSAKDELKRRRKSQRVILDLEGLCEFLPAEKRSRGLELVEEIDLETDILEILSGISDALAYLKPNIELHAYESVNTQELKAIQKELSVVGNKLDEIKYTAFKQSISSGNAASNLIAIKSELEKLYQIASRYPNSNLKEIYSCHEMQLHELSSDIDDRFAELEDILKGKASTNDIRMVLDKWDELRPVETWDSRFWNLADKGATLLTYISFLGEVIAVLKPG